MSTTAGKALPLAQPAEVAAPDPQREPVTLRTIERFVREKQKFACLTCYDATTARWLERAGVPLLLAGDSAAEVILGLPGTIHAPLDFMLTITAAVKRGAPRTFIMGDMPFMSYQADDAEALRNAGRFLTEGGADAVKLEVVGSFAPLVEKMSRAGIPVCAHLGCKPQSVKRDGGYRVAGRTAREASEIVADALAMQQAGARMILLEASPNEVSQAVVEQVSVPVIGCGAGEACHGQILVLHDLLGLSDRRPSFAQPLRAGGRELIHAAENWIQKVAASDFGPHPYHMAEGEGRKLEQESERGPS